MTQLHSQTFWDDILWVVANKSSASGEPIWNDFSLIIAYHTSKLWKKKVVKTVVSVAEDV